MVANRCPESDHGLGGALVDCKERCRAAEAEHPRNRHGGLVRRWHAELLLYRRGHDDLNKLVHSKEPRLIGV